MIRMTGVYVGPRDLLRICKLTSTGMPVLYEAVSCGSYVGSASGIDFLRLRGAISDGGKESALAKPRNRSQPITWRRSRAAENKQVEQGAIN